MADFKPIVDKTFSFEGGYQNFAHDSANYNSRGDLVGTNNGISATAYETYLKRPPTVQDIKAITKDIAKDVYKKLFWDRVQGDQIKNQSSAQLSFDTIIASGGTGLKQIREAVNKTAGKKIVQENAQSLSVDDVNKLNLVNQQGYFDKLKQIRIAFIDSLVKNNPEKYAAFEKGWKNRLSAIVFSGATAAAGIGLLLIGAAFFFLNK